MKKRTILALALTLVVILALFAFTACNDAKTSVGTDLLASTNGNFEASDSAISGWYSSLSNGDTQLGDGATAKTDLDLGAEYLVLTSKGNVNMVYQTVAVDKNAVYKVTVDMRLLSNVTDGNGAYVTFKENDGYKFVLAKDKSTFGTWATQTFFIRPKNMNNLTLCLALDTGKQSSTVISYFDNVTFTRVEESSVTSTIYDIKQTKNSATYNSTAAGISFIVLLTIASVALLVGAYLLIRRVYAKSNAFISLDGEGKSTVGAKKVLTNTWTVLGLLLAGAFAIRLILLLCTYGLGQSMTSLAQLAYSLRSTSAVTGAYGGIITADSTAGVLSSSTYSTLSPGAVYILAIIGATMKSSTDYFAASILIRLVEVIADMAIVAMIYFYGKKYVGNRISTIYAALYAVLPVTFVMSGIVGTFDCMVIALTLAALLLMVEKKYIPMFVLITLAAVLNIEALAVAPLMVAYLVYMWYKDDKNLKKVTANRVIIPVGLVLSFVLAYIIVLPVAINTISAAPFGGFSVMVNELKNNLIFVNNAFNLYGMCGMNMSSANSTASILNLVFLLVLEIYVISLYAHNRNKMEVLMLASFTFAIIAVFTLKISYTYMLLALALGFIYTMISGDKRMYAIMGCYSVLTFMCVAQMLNLSGVFVADQTIGSGSLADIVSLKMANYYELDAFFILFSVVTVLVTLYYGYVSYNITNSGHIADIKPLNERISVATKNWFAHIGTNLKNFFAPKSNKKTSD